MVSDSPADVHRRVWTIGDYPKIAAHLLPISIETVAAVRLEPGDRVLDVGVGDGNAAIEASRYGARVTGIDLTPAQIERARTRCAGEGVEVDLRVGDASDLDMADCSFDVVLSVMAVIFAPDHIRATAEMVRVCRPGGTVAITTWAEGRWLRTTRSSHRCWWRWRPLTSLVRSQWLPRSSYGSLGLPTTDIARIGYIGGLRGGRYLAQDESRSPHGGRTACELLKTGP